MLLSIGEILADVTLEISTGKMQAYVGGAPFNVAVNAAKTGTKTRFIGRVGNDPVGKFIVNTLRDKCPYLSADIQIDNDRNTTMAFVSVDKNGERDFTFLRKDAADFHIEFSEKDLDGFKETDIINVGSLMLSEQKGRETAEKIFQSAKARNIPVAFDVNFRKDLFKTNEDAINAYAPFLQKADILKFSEDEAEMFFLCPLQEGLQRFQDKIVCVTLGKNGCVLNVCGTLVSVPTLPVSPVDTTGAGDAFWGTFLSSLTNTGVNINPLIAASIAEKANASGAAAALHSGAVCF